MKRARRFVTQPRTMVVAVMLGAALSAAEANATSANCDKAVTDIQRYCTACWRNARLHPDSWTDCTQEVFSRLLQRVPVAAWDRVLDLESAERREFVRAIDAVKKRTQRTRKYSALNEEVAENRARDTRDDRDLVNRAAQHFLSDRQQSILAMSFDGYSVQEVADRLALPPERVSDEKYKAIRKLRHHLGVEA